MACFPRIWKSVKIIPIVKPGKETNDDISKYRPISFINKAAKVFEKVLINGIMHHIYTSNPMCKNQYRFTPQRSREDAMMALTHFVQKSINKGQLVEVINLNVKRAFDANWWPSLLVGSPPYRGEQV